MIQSFLFVFLSVFIFQANAAEDRCAYSLKNEYGLTSIVLSENYFVRIHKTLAGELDPYVLGDGGVVVGYLLTESKKVLVFYENRDTHPFTTKVVNALNTGWPFLLVRARCQMRPVGPAFVAAA